MRYCGREFTETELNRIRSLISDHPLMNRAGLSRLVCEEIAWRREDERLKDMSCRVAMLRMYRDGLIELPPSRGGNSNGKPYRRRTSEAEPETSPVLLSAGAFGDLELRLIADTKQSHLWNEFIDRYHYLGYKPLPGAQLRYFVFSAEKVLALLGFGAAAWTTAPRDHFIGWTTEQRQRNLHLVVNNARFLLLPWVKSKNLASRILSLSAKRLPGDWQERYGYRPVLMETFVEIPRFRGICYKAANWLYLGDTTGRGKLGPDHKALLPIKAIWVRPLVKKFRQVLCQ